ncbi:MAG: hypothetical protein DCC75_04395 [Proteobacteria bacterium]|nr:MAG: hypothetical protein DCC75_04395 [Pseudomonadota bacterium]
MKRNVIGIAALIIAWSLVSASQFTHAQSPSDKSASAELKVGVILGLTGPAAKWGKFQRLGIELAAKEIKSSGAPLNVIFEDSASEPSKAVTAFRKLVSVDHVSAVIGDIFAYITEPLIPLADQEKVLLVSPATPASMCARTSGFFFSTATQVPDAARGFEVFLERNSAVRRLALIYFDDPGWGGQYHKNWLELASKRSLQVTDRVGISDFRPDFKALLPKMLAKQPDAFFVAHEPETFISAARALGYKGKIVFANNIQEVLVDSSFDRALLEGVYFVDTLAGPEFMEEFMKLYDSEPILESYNGYEALRALFKAWQLNPADPRKAFSGLNYQGASGPLDFSQSCAGNRSVWHLKQFKGGKILRIG